jgi:septum formation protein
MHSLKILCYGDCTMLIDKIKNYHLILASKSPRRQFLLHEAGFDFEVVVEDGIEENYPESLPKEEIPVYLSKYKATAYKNIPQGTVIITADTIVWCNNEMLGKPDGYEGAIAMLKKLSGRKHEVITGVCLTSSEKQTSFRVISNVYFKALTEEEIHYYVKNYQPYDKAGAYGIQEWIGYVGIERIEGSYFNVMGLPVQQLYVELDSFLV